MTTVTPAPRPTRKIYDMKVESLRDLTSNVRELVISSSDEFIFKAGQFVMLHVPQGEGVKPALRAYSISSGEQNKNGFKLLFKYVDQGKASEFVWKLTGGETLQFTGPFGKVFFQEPPTEQIIFLNTGTGLSQHLSYLESKMAQYPNLGYKMYFGVRTEADIYYEPELQKLKASLPNFEYHYVLSRPPDSWTGKKGYVQNFIESEVDWNKPVTFYLCGNGGMIKATKEILASHNIPADKIWSEAFD